MIEASPSNEHIHNEKRYSLFKNFATSPTESQVNFVMSFRNFSNYQFSYENSNYKSNNIEYTRKKIWNAVHKLKLYKRKREQQLTKESKCILYPGLSTIKPFIDAFYILLLFTDFIISPFIYFVYLAYNSKLSSIIREIIFDALFAVEIVLTFFTGYYHHSLDKIITNHKIIAKHYITHSFIIDLLAVIPFYYVFDNHNLIFIRLIKLYRYPKLISQIQYALYNIYGLCFKTFRPRTKITEITVFIISFIYIIHLFACVYIFIGLFFLNKQHYDDTWIKHFVFDSISVLDVKHVYIIYIASMHQICQILTMLGYGDLVPITDEEKIFIMFCEIIACGLYAYLLTCLWEILLHNEYYYFQSTVQVNHFKLQKWINNFVNNLPQQSNTVNLHRDELWKDVKKYFELYYQSEKNFNWINKVNYIKQIKPLQRKELLYNAFDNVRKKFSLLQSIDNLNTVHRIILQFKTIIEIKGKTIINEGDVYNKVYFIDEGSVTIIKNKMKIGQLTKGMVFGLEGLFYSKSPFTYEVSDVAEFAVLFSVDYEFLFKEVLNYDNQVFEVVQEMSNEYMKKVLEGEFDECNDNLLFEKNGSFYSRKTIVKEAVDGKRIGDDDDDNGNLNLLGSLPKLKEMIEMYKAKEREVDEIDKRLKLIEMQLGFINDNENVCKGK